MRSRLRSAIKWSCTLLTVLLLVLWVWSAWWYAGIKLLPTGSIDVSAGGVCIGWYEPWSIVPVDSGWMTPDRHSWPLEWWFHGERDTLLGGGYFVIPIWALVVLFATPTSWLWDQDRRRQPDLCANCGYDLRGAAHEMCPECGGEAPNRA